MEKTQTVHFAKKYRWVFHGVAKMQLEKKSPHGILETAVPNSGDKHREHVAGGGQACMGYKEVPYGVAHKHVPYCVDKK